MKTRNNGRIALAVIAAWVANAILVGITEAFLLWPWLAPHHRAKPLSYFVADLITQCLYTVIAGYLCCVIARPTHRIAMFILIGLGLVIGGVSTFFSWNMEPHWYRIALLAVYPVCVWIGWRWRVRLSRGNVPAHHQMTR
jgi:hypothetical protein